MKKTLVMLLALAMVCSLVPVTAAADLYEDSDIEYENQDIFSIKESTATLYPGVDYYFDCEWHGGDITDDFFEFYTVSVGASQADDDEPKTTEAKKIAEVAEFSKAEGQDKYYFHFRAKANYNYPDHDEVLILISVVAKDKSRDNNRVDSRSWYQFDLEIGYPGKNDTKIVTQSSYEVDNDYPRVEFDDDVEYCRLKFEDGSNYSVYLDRVREFNLGQSTDANKAIADAHPNATLKFVTFYAKPKFASENVLKVYAPGCSYLYEIGNNNTLTLIATGSNDGYIGVTTDELSAYVASSEPLNTAATGSANYDNAALVGPSHGTPQYSAGGSGTGVIGGADGPTSIVVTNPNTGADV